MGLAGGGSSEFAYKTLIFSLAIMILLPLFLTMFAPTVYHGDQEDELLDGYSRMTGQAANTKVSVWPLTGIYTPYTGSVYDPETQKVNTYGYTQDGWLYGQEVKSYVPSQYKGTDQSYSVYKASDGVFRYWENSRDYVENMGLGHAKDDLYTEVSFDKTKQSDIFFTEGSKQEDKNGHFKFDFTGYRFAFQPISNYTAQNEDNQRIPVIATTTSLSLIWYQVPTQGGSGVAGQLILSGSDSGVAYINEARLLSAFHASTSTASFDMVFNGVKMTIYIKIDPYYLYQGWTVAQCYAEGYWSIMVTSLSVDYTAYTGTDNADNPMAIFETMIDLLTFNLDDYDFSPAIEWICYIVFIAPLYVGLIALCLDNLSLIHI